MWIIAAMWSEQAGQSWDQTHQCGAVWSAMPTSGSAKPIKNAKNPWALPKAKLQSFLIFFFFHLTHAKLSNSPTSTNTWSRHCETSVKGKPDGFPPGILETDFVTCHIFWKGCRLDFERLAPSPGCYYSNSPCVCLPGCSASSFLIMCPPL